jgi:predicted ATPase
VKGDVARSIVVVTGASGTGKTAAVTSLDACALAGVRV